MAKPVYVGAAPWVAASGEEQDYGLFRSTGAGESWERLTRGLPERPEVRALALDPADPDTVYAATQKGPFRSRDGGDSWASLGLEDAGTGWSVALHPADREVLLAGTVDGGVYRSSDGGAGWLARALPAGVEGIYAIACV